MPSLKPTTEVNVSSVPFLHALVTLYVCLFFVSMQGLRCV